MQLPKGRKPLMYLAYLDDSGRKLPKKRAVQVLAALLIKDEHFSPTEAAAAFCIEHIVPEAKLSQFEEFHAWELYGGHEIFEGVDQHERFRAITFLLDVVRDNKMPIIYGAVDTQQLKSQLYASANPVDIAFRICTKGIEQWMDNNDPAQLAILISDDFQEKDIKTKLRKSFRELRKRRRPPDFKVADIDEAKVYVSHIHDDMYFGDSKESIGLQMADLCAYFIGKHLEGEDVIADGFYNIIKDQIVYSQMEPELVK